MTRYLNFLSAAGIKEAQERIYYRPAVLDFKAAPAEVPWSDTDSEGIKEEVDIRQIVCQAHLNADHVESDDNVTNALIMCN